MKGRGGVGHCWKAFENYGYCGPKSPEDSEDVNFIAAMIKTLLKEHDIPNSRVVVAGFSNGASMAFRFYCEASHLIGGLVIIGQAFFDPYKGFFDYQNNRVSVLAVDKFVFIFSPFWLSFCLSDDLPLSPSPPFFISSMRVCSFSCSCSCSSACAWAWECLSVHT